jgi:hypothetical protein
VRGSAFEAGPSGEEGGELSRGLGVWSLGAEVDARGGASAVGVEIEDGGAGQVTRARRVVGATFGGTVSGADEWFGGEPEFVHLGGRELAEDGRGGAGGKAVALGGAEEGIGLDEIPRGAERRSGGYGRGVAGIGEDSEGECEIYGGGACVGWGRRRASRKGGEEERGGGAEEVGALHGRSVSRRRGFGERE